MDDSSDRPADSLGRVPVDLRWGRANTKQPSNQPADPSLAYVFVSSTFQDMHGERDHISRVVVPKLRLVAALYGVEVLEIDLRAGVTEWIMASPEDALWACREQIDRCRPFFVCLIGERYGSVLPGIDRSITDLEIEHALNGAAGKQGISFFLRNSSVLSGIPDIRKSDFVEEYPATIKKLERLKHFIRRELASLVAYDGYPARWDASAFDWSSGQIGRLVDLDPFGNTVTAVVWSHLKKSLGLPDRPLQHTDPARREQAEQRAWLVNSSRSKLVRRPLAAQLEASLGSGRPTLLVGAPGQEKTPTLLFFCEDLASNHREVFFLLVGPTHQSA